MIKPRSINQKIGEYAKMTILTLLFDRYLFGYARAFGSIPTSLPFTIKSLFCAPTLCFFRHVELHGRLPASLDLRRGSCDESTGRFWPKATIQPEPKSNRTLCGMRQSSRLGFSAKLGSSYWIRWRGGKRQYPLKDYLFVAHKGSNQFPRCPKTSALA